MARRRTELLQIRLTPQEKALLKAAADASNVSMAELMRLFTFAFIKDIVERTPSSTFDLLTMLKLLPIVPKIKEPDDE